MSDRREGGELSLWQRAESRAAVVLDEVFCWLEGRELARAGATCRLWRAVSAAPALWRRLVLRDQLDSRGHVSRHCRWREQYVCAHAAWHRTDRKRFGAHALHGALSAAGDRLAVAAADATVSVWKPEEDTWVEQWRCDLRESRGWASAARVSWTSSGLRLLAAGPLALAETGSSWELLVLEFDERGVGRIASRTRCGAGAAGCWVNSAGDAFLSLEPLLLAPGLGVTSVWLNAATQETQSEYAGVASCLFRIYNEGGAHLSHVVVMGPVSDAEAEHCDPPHREPIMVATWGETLGAWPLSRSRLAPVEVCASGSLSDRVRVMREQALLPDPEPAEPDEATVRTQCATPVVTHKLRTTVIGLVLLTCHGEPRLWVTTSDGAVAGFSTPGLIRMCVFASPAPPAPLVLYYVQPAVSEHYVASPQGSLSGTVCVWAVRGAGSRRARLLGHGAPAAVALLPHGYPPKMLVLAGDELHVWTSCATPQPDTGHANSLASNSNCSVNVLKIEL